MGEDKRRARNNEMRNGWPSLKSVTVLPRKQRDYFERSYVLLQLLMLCNNNSSIDTLQ